GGVPEPRSIFRHEPLEEFGEVAAHVEIGVLLNDEGRRSVLNENGQQPGLDLLHGHPARYFAGDFVQALATRRNLQFAVRLNHPVNDYSTVTLLARLRG